MDAWVDLHIHSCLSPCASDEMTPWNIVGMAKVAGLDVIAVTDHNSAKNLPQVCKAGQEYGVSILPGMELNTREEIHALAYFETLEQALAADEDIYKALPDVGNEATLFGNQLIMGDEDAVIAQENKLLINALSLSIGECQALVEAHGGILVPAHINRGTNGMLGNLGLMPPLPEYPLVEVYTRIPCPPIAIKGRAVLHSSDAHQLEDIAGKDFSLPLEKADAKALFAYLRRMAYPD